MAIGQTVFQDRLKANLSKVVSNTVVEEIISAGATNIDSLVSSDELPAVIQGYSKSITQVFVSLSIVHGSHL